MKTTIDIPDELLKDTMRLSKAPTKREAVVTALEEYTRHKRMVKLVKQLGTSDGFYTPQELEKLRRME